MSALRRSVLRLLALCTALAVGIAVGSGPLQNRFTTASDTRPGAGAEGSGAANIQRGQRLTAAVMSQTSDRLLRGRLTGRIVTLVVLPGVPSATVATTLSALRQAGAVDPVVAHLRAEAVDPANRTYVDSVAASSLGHHGDVRRQAGTQTYERIGAVLARAYVGSGGDTAYDSDARDIDAELQGAKLVTLDQTPVRRGNLVLVVAPRTPSRGQYAAASRIIEEQLVVALVSRSDGAVLVQAAPASQAGVTDGWPSDVRRGLPLSTLNVATRPASPVVAVYAMLAAADGNPGDFGVIGASVRLPPGLAASGG